MTQEKEGLVEALTELRSSAAAYVQGLEDENRRLMELLNMASNHVPLSQLTLRGNIDDALAPPSPPAQEKGE